MIHATLRRAQPAAGRADRGTAMNDAKAERGGPAKRAGDFLAEILRAANPRRRGGLFELTEAWSRAAGPEVARRTRIVSLAKDTLTVAVESAALRQELETYRKEEILARLNAEFPKRVATLKCVLGHL